MVSNLGQVNFKAPVTYCLQCSRVIFLKYKPDTAYPCKKQFHGPAVLPESNSSFLTSLMGPEGPSPASCLLPCLFILAPGLHSNVSLFLYSSVGISSLHAFTHTAPPALWPSSSIGQLSSTHLVDLSLHVPSLSLQVWAHQLSPWSHSLSHAHILAFITPTSNHML